MKIRNEPVAVVAALSAFGSAVLTLLASTLHWSDDLLRLVTPVWGTFIALLLALVVRPQVTPNGRVMEVAHDAIVALSPAGPDPVVGGWYSDGAYPLEHLIHLSGITPDGRWQGDGYRRGIDGALRAEYVDAKWASSQEMGATWRRTAQPVDYTPG